MIDGSHHRGLGFESQTHTQKQQPGMVGIIQDSRALDPVWLPQARPGGCWGSLHDAGQLCCPIRLGDGRSLLPIHTHPHIHGGR